MTKSDFLEILWKVTLSPTLIGFSAMIGFAFGLGFAARVERDRAIESGVAEWRIDAKTGEKSFHYLTPEPKK